MGSRLVEIKNRIQASQSETASTGRKTTTRSGIGGSRVREIKRKMVADVDGEYVQSFLNDSRDYITNTQREYEGLTWQNARSEEINVSRANASATMNERSRKVRTYLDAYKEDIPEEQYTVFKNYLDDFSTFQDQVAAGFRSTRAEFSQFDTEDDNHAYLTTQKQLAEDPDRLNREIAVLENMYTIYEDLTTREISEAEEAKLARLRQQYPFLGDLKAAIKEKKKYFKTVTQLQDQAKQADERAVWEAEYSDKSYAELQKILGRLDAGAEKTWLSDYADTKKTKDDWEKELTDAQADLAYYEKLRSERDRLMQFQAMSPDTPGYVQLKKQWEAYHNQFDGLDERIDALEKKIWEQERIVRYYDLSQNEDYAEKSQYYGGGDALQEMVNNPEMTGFLDNAATVGKLINPGVGAASLLYEVLPYDNLQHMTNNERADYNYIYATEGKEAAKDYLEWLQYTLDERSMNNAMTIVSDATQSIPVLSQVTASLLSTPVALMGGTGLLDAAGQKLVNKITGENKPINYNRDAMFFTKASGTARGTVAQNIADATGVINFDEEKHPVLARILNGKSLADVYQLGMSMQDSAAVAALAVINPVLGKVGAALLGGAAGTQAMLDAVQRGATDEQALTIGILSGAFEMLFEKYELDSLLGQGKNFWQAFSINGLSNAAGESATEVANILADVAVMAEKSNWKQNINRYLDENPDWDYSQAEKQAFIDAALQVGEASVGGWISGSTMGGGYSTFQNIVDSIQKNQQANTIINQEEVAKSLRSKGVDLRKAEALGEAIAARLNDHELTRSQSELLSFESGSPTVLSVVSEFMKNRKSNVQQHTTEQRHDEFSKVTVLPEPYESLENTAKTILQKQETTERKQRGIKQAQKTLAELPDCGIMELTNTDTRAIYDYMSAKAYITNEKLRTGVPITEEDQTFLNNLDAALKKMPAYQGDLTRSLIFETDDDVQAFIRMYTEGEVMKYDQYISTTQGGIYNPDGQVQILISNAKRGRDISTLNPNETEVLYERGMTFRVVSVRKIGGRYYLLMEESNE